MQDDGEEQHAGSLEPAAASETSQAAAAATGSLQTLTQLSLAELRQQCQEFGLSSTGKKQDLVQRIIQHVEEYYDGELEEGASRPAAPLTAAAAADDINMDELMMELEAEFAGNSKQELISALQNKGLPTDGSKAQLVTRLAEAVSAE